jgi:hypothetical protein
MHYKVIILISLIVFLGGCLTSSQDSLSELDSSNKPPSFDDNGNVIIAVGEYVEIKLNALDPEREELNYSTSNFPPFLTLDPNTSIIFGTPKLQDIGVYQDIKISISDGINTIIAGPYTVQVEKELFKIEVTWTEVTQDVDSDNISNVSGYKIYLSKALDDYYQEVTIEDSTIISHNIGRLAAGTYFISMKSYLTSGLESELSNEKQIIL